MLFKVHPNTFFVPMSVISHNASTVHKLFWMASWRTFCRPTLCSLQINPQNIGHLHLNPLYSTFYNQILHTLVYAVSYNPPPLTLQRTPKTRERTLPKKSVVLYYTTFCIYRKLETLSIVVRNTRLKLTESALLIPQLILLQGPNH